MSTEPNPRFVDPGLHDQLLASQEFNTQLNDLDRDLETLRPTSQEIEAINSRAFDGGYSQEDAKIVRRGMRVEQTMQDSALFMSPLVSPTLRSSIIEGYKAYINEDISLEQLNATVMPAVPAMTTTAAAKRMLGIDEYETATEELLSFQASNPAIFQKLEEFGMASASFFPDGLYGADRTIDISTGVGSVPGDLGNMYSKNQALSLIRPGLSPDQLDHMNKMVGLVASDPDCRIDLGFYNFTNPNRSNPSQDLGRFGFRSLVRHIREKSGNIPEGKSFKLHLMPGQEQVADVAVELHAMIASNPNLSNAISGFKVQTVVRGSEDMGTNPTPDIVVYPKNDIYSIAMGLHELQMRFGGRQGRGLVPRFNVPVNGSTMLYMAEGHGHEKKALYELDESQLAAVYDPDQNYAFSRADQSLVRKIMDIASHDQLYKN